LTLSPLPVTLRLPQLFSRASGTSLSVEKQI
jgi:hypothetical protein